MISTQRVQELKQLFKDEYKVELSDQEAQDAGQKLVDYFSLLIEIDQNTKSKEKNEKRQYNINLKKTY